MTTIILAVVTTLVIAFDCWKVRGDRFGDVGKGMV